jgi:hypothetical protein
VHFVIHKILRQESRRLLLRNRRTEKGVQIALVSGVGKHLLVLLRCRRHRRTSVTAASALSTTVIATATATIIVATALATAATAAAAALGASGGSRHRTVAQCPVAIAPLAPLSVVLTASTAEAAEAAAAAVLFVDGSENE